MKGISPNIKKILIIGIIFLLVVGIYSIVYSADKFVDIPVPPNSAGKADFTSEEGEEEAKKYEENKIKEEQSSSNTIQENIEKSGNNYLKSLRVEGYKLEPKFNMQQDNYVVYVSDKSKIKELNIIAEPDDKKARVEGVGVVEITPEQQYISVNVIAENGNLKVYTIKVENQANRPEDKSKGINVMIVTVIVVLIIGGIVIITDKKSKHKNKVKG